MDVLALTPIALEKQQTAGVGTLKKKLITRSIPSSNVSDGKKRIAI